MLDADGTPWCEAATDAGRAALARPGSRVETENARRHPQWVAVATHQRLMVWLTFVMSSPRAIFLALFALCIAAAAILVAGCDSSGTVIATDAGADATGPDVVVNFDGPTLFDVVAPVDSGAGEADAAPSSDAAAFAFIEFSEVPVGGGAFTAAFFAAPRQPPPGCTGQAPDGGSCLVTTCPDHAPTDAGLVVLASAGALDVTGGAFGDAGVQVGADTLGSYLYNTTGPMFAPGDMLGVSGAGGTVPAFPMQTLAAPAAITVTAPEPGDGGTLVIPTSKDLAVTWTGGVPGDHVIFTLNVLFASGASASTACSWDAQAGQGTVPANALAPLVAGTAQAGGSTAVWYQQAQTSFATGRWAVTMQADIHGGSLATFQ